MDVIDNEGFRPNVGIILADGKGRLLLAKRIGQDAWQFPQGGIDAGEKPHDAMYRELYEEVGLESNDVEILAHTRGWLRYRLPKRYIRRNKSPVCVGQKQKWYLLRLAGDQNCIRFDRGKKPEFDGWKWVNYWYPISQVIEFKRDVYRKALKELAHVHSELERKLSHRKR
jgi:putative (di)nucleoside polyphosphate hydrolase